MAAPVLVESNGSSFTFGGASSRSVTFAATPAADEIIILIYSATDITTAASSFSWGTGFTEFLAPTTTNAVQVAAAWKRAGGSESDTFNVTYTAGSGGNERLIGLRYTGCTTSGSPIDASGTQTFSFPGTSLSAGALTASVAETLHNIYLSSNGGLSAPTCTGYAETVYNQAFGGNAFGMDSRALFNNDIASSGSVSNQTISQTSGGGFFNVTAFSFLLLPGATPGALSGKSNSAASAKATLSVARPITVDNGGTLASNSSTTTMAGDVGIACVAGDVVVVVVAADNNGTNGANSISSVTDAGGNTYTQRNIANQDPGAAAAGATVAIYSSKLTTALASTDDVTVNFSPATTAKSAIIYRLRPGAGYSIEFGAALGTSTGSVTDTATSLSSAPQWALVVAGVAVERTSATVTGDSDTTNGSWSTARSIASGGTMIAAAQTKLLTAAGAQTWNLTWTTGADAAAAGVSFTAEGVFIGNAASAAGAKGTLSISNTAGKANSASSAKGTLSAATIFTESWGSVASLTSRNGDVAVARWTVGRANSQLETDLNRYEDGDWPSYRDAGGANTNAPPGDVQVSITNGMVQIAAGAQDYGETQLWALPKFNFAYASGVQVEVDLPSTISPLQAYPVIHIADRHYSWIGLYTDNGKSGLAQYGLSIQFFSHTVGIRVMQSNNNTETELTPTTQNAWTSGVRNLRLKLTSTRLEVYDLTGSVVLWEGAHGISITAGMLGLAVHNHASGKYDGVWGSGGSRATAPYYRFGEVIAAIDSRADTIVGQVVNAHGTTDTAGGVNIGYDVPTSGMPTLSFSLSSVGTSAHLSATIKCAFTWTGTIEYRLNGGTWTACTLYTANTTDLAARLISQSVPVAALVTGSNTIEFRSSVEDGYGPNISNVDVFTWDISSTVSLSGKANTAAGAKGTLNTEKPLVAKSSAAAATTASLNTAKPLAAKSNASAGLTGTLNTSKPLDAKANAAAGATASLNTAKPMEAKSNAAVGLTGTLITLTPISAKTNAAAGATASLNTTKPLSAKADAASGATASMAVERALSAKSSAAAGATASLITEKPLTAKGNAAAGLKGTLEIAGQNTLDGELPNAASLKGTLVQAQALVAKANAAASLKGTTTAQINAKSSSAAGLTGSLVTEKPVSAKANSSASGTASLTTTKPISAKANASAGATASLSVAKPLSAKANSASSATATMGVAGGGPLNLNPAEAPSSASAKGTLSVAVALTAKGATASGTKGTLSVSVPLQGRSATAGGAKASITAQLLATGSTAASAKATLTTAAGATTGKASSASSARGSLITTKPLTGKASSAARIRGRLSTSDYAEAHVWDSNTSTWVACPVRRYDSGSGTWVDDDRIKIYSTEVGRWVRVNP